jgi:hypothetical protein
LRRTLLLIFAVGIWVTICNHEIGTQASTRISDMALEASLLFW